MSPTLDSDDLLVFRVSILLQSLADAAQERTPDTDTSIELDDDLLDPSGPPSSKTPFKFQDPSYQPDTSQLEPSPEVVKQWEAYLVEHPEASREAAPVLGVRKFGLRDVPKATPTRRKRGRSPSAERSDPSTPGHTPSRSAARRARAKRAKAAAAASIPAVADAVAPTATAAAAAAATTAAPVAVAAAATTAATTATAPVAVAAAAPAATPATPVAVAAAATTAAAPVAVAATAPTATPAAAATAAAPVAAAPVAATAPIDAAVPVNATTFAPGTSPRKRSQASRDAKRQKQDAAWKATHGHPSQCPESLPTGLAAKHLDRVQPVRVEQLEHADLATNESVYIGPPPVSKAKVDHLQDFQWAKEDYGDLPPSVRKYLDEGFTIMKNDPSKTQIVEDANGVILVLKALPPRSMLWKLITESVERQLAKLHDALTDHAYDIEKGATRTNGLFKHATMGFSMGGGQHEPKYLNVRNEWHAALRAFIDHPDVRIYARHMSNIFRFWFPKLFKLYQKLCDDVNARFPDAHPAFPGFPFFTETPNTGKQVRTPEHVDFKNALFGMCVIAVFGAFDHNKSGMLVLRELKILMPLAPGDIVFIPSALITHGNTELAESDIRRSWTLFTAGGLFRFVDAGFVTERELTLRGEVDTLARFHALQPLLLQHRLSTHMTLDQLHEYHNAPKP